MKWIKYKKQVGQTNIGAESDPVFEPILQDMGLEYSPENEAVVRQIAYNGEYIIEDDGEPEPAHEPTTEELLNAMLGVTE